MGSELDWESVAEGGYIFLLEYLRVIRLCLRFMVFVPFSLHFGGIFFWSCDCDTIVFKGLPVSLQIKSTHLQQVVVNKKRFTLNMLHCVANCLLVVSTPLFAGA